MNTQKTTLSNSTADVRVERNPILQSQILLSRSDLKQLGIRVSNSSLLRWEASGRFPRRIRMAGTSVAWLRSEVDAWLVARAEERSRHIYADF